MSNFVAREKSRRLDLGLFDRTKNVTRRCSARVLEYGAEAIWFGFSLLQILGFSFAFFKKLLEMASKLFFWTVQTTS